VLISVTTHHSGSACLKSDLDRSGMSEALDRFSRIADSADIANEPKRSSDEIRRTE
jgi:hypothetical protein